MALLGSNLHTRLAIVTENELRPDPSTFYLVIVVTNRQTNAGDYIIPRESFRGDKHHFLTLFWKIITYDKIDTCIVVLGTEDS